MYEKKYHIGTSDVDMNMELRLSSLFLMMQDVATEHAEVLGVGMSQTIDKGQFWVITRYSVSIIENPKYLDDIIVRTYPGDDKKFIFPRYFEIVDKNNKVVIKASSTWCVLRKSDRGISLNPFDGKVLPPEHHEGEEPLPAKVLPDEKHLVETRKVRYSETDLNNHLNNTKYIEYIIDLHDSEFYKTHRISHITINYEKEILSGDSVSLFSNGKNPEYINGSVDGKNIFEAEIQYKTNGDII